MVYISIRLNDIRKEQLDKFIFQLNEISKIMNGLIIPLLTTYKSKVRKKKDTHKGRYF